jgi:hypothetical protein
VITRSLRPVFACVALLVLAGAAASAQELPLPLGQGMGADLSPVQVQRLFDAYAIVQAQEMLALTDAQYAQFVTRLKALQEARRRNQQARNGILLELRRLTQPRPGGLGAPAGPGPDDALIRDRLKALADLDARAAAELRKSYDGIDEVLDVRQQARFRLLEERLERQQLELLMRARQGPRPQAPVRRVPQRPPA